MHWLPRGLLTHGIPPLFNPLSATKVGVLVVLYFQFHKLFVQPEKEIKHDCYKLKTGGPKQSVPSLDVLGSL